MSRNSEDLKKETPEEKPFLDSLVALEESFAKLLKRTQKFYSRDKSEKEKNASGDEKPPKSDPSSPNCG